MERKVADRFAPAAALAAAVLAASLLAACGDSGGDRLGGMPAVQPPENMADVRNLTREELDTLRVLQERNRVTRDEYWDDRGGVLANDWLEVWYPPGKLTVTHGMYVLNLIMQCRPVIEDLFGRVPEGQLTIVCSQTLKAYSAFTGREWWHYSYIEPDRIIYQPITVLSARGVLDMAIQREFYEWAALRIGTDRLPIWLASGLASRLAQEETILTDNLGEFPGEPVKRPMDEIESALEARDNKKLTRLAFYNAYAMVRRLEVERGRDRVAAMIVALGEGSDRDAAAQSAFGMTYDELVAFARDWTPPAKETSQ